MFAAGGVAVADGRRATPATTGTPGRGFGEFRFGRE